MKNKKLLLLIFGLIMTAQMIYSQVPSYVPTNGLIGYWPFNGNANDQSGNGNNGIVISGLLSNDRFGNANSSYYLNGQTDYIKVPSVSSMLPNRLTLSAWVKIPSNYTGNNGIAPIIRSRFYGYILLFDLSNGSIIHVLHHNSSATTTTNTPSNINDNQWHQIVGTFDGTNNKLYLDGQLISTTVTTTLSNLYYVSDGPVTFGRDGNNPSTATAMYQGWIDDIGIWNRALTPSEIQLLYTGCSTPAPTGLACWETATFDTTSCSWVVTGVQPAAPTGLACYETTAFNTTSCAWDITGTQPVQPTPSNCFDNFVFNTTNCAWENTAVQPEQPTVVNCWDTFTFDTTSCAWVNNNTPQPTQPSVVNCWDNFVFNTVVCAWVYTGTQPVRPTPSNCWDNYQFDTTTCVWVNMGNPSVIPTGSTSQTLCSGSTVANLTATGTNIKWYATSTGGTALAATTALVNGTTYYASQTVNGCESTTRLAVTVSLNATATITLTSGEENLISSGCYFPDIVYTLGNGATGVNVYSPWPNWITTTTIGTTVTISFNNSPTPPPGWWYFEISTTGGCGNATRTFMRGIDGIIGVELRSPTGTDNQTTCINDPIQDVRYAVTSFFGLIFPNAFGLPAGVTLSRDFSTNEIIFSGTPTEAGVFNYSIYNDLCGGPTFYGGTITVNSTPTPTGANNQTITQGSTIANLVVAGQNIVWYSTPFEGTPLTLNTPLVNGTTYYASQTINGCESQDRLPVTVQFTLNNNEFDSINIVYNPNPVIDILTIKASIELKNAKIYNVLGQPIFQKRFNSNEIQLNISNVPTGTYFVIVESDNRKETFKILKK